MGIGTFSYPSTFHPLVCLWTSKVIHYPYVHPHYLLCLLWISWPRYNHSSSFLPSTHWSTSNLWIQTNFLLPVTPAGTVVEGSYSLVIHYQDVLPSWLPTNASIPCAHFHMKETTLSYRFNCWFTHNHMHTVFCSVCVYSFL